MTKDLIVKIYLIPKNDILTVETVHPSKSLSNLINIDSLLGGLYDQSPTSNFSGLMNVNHSEFLCSNTNERCFKWIHSLAGLKFETTNMMKGNIDMLVDYQNKIDDTP